MVAGDTRVADPVDPMYHEMASMVCSHCVYKSVWLPVIGERLILVKEPASQSTQYIQKYLIINFSFLHFMWHHTS